ncbi:uncharacterized protein SAPINGB_P002472 [Magnusiomyces paraingens]|uniref:Integrase catalytic domain-containing protein n=1 Tax=Magnusiomyces paraingens TaxID=2606893 RepID=A0A5E8BE39_9ASCO|nr:uncharacterized protein SAPINGB_P002472 [Saprochaete ingens]VVT49845.1 unnamed protein product [Saprochaete ingens]
MSNHGNTTGVNEGPSSFESASTGSSVAHSTSETHSKNNASSYETFADLPVHRQIDLLTVLDLPARRPGARLSFYQRLNHIGLRISPSPELNIVFAMTQAISVGVPGPSYFAGLTSSEIETKIQATVTEASKWASVVEQYFFNNPDGTFHCDLILAVLNNNKVSAAAREDPQSHLWGLPNIFDNDGGSSDYSPVAFLPPANQIASVGETNLPNVLDSEMLLVTLSQTTATLCRMRNTAAPKLSAPMVPSLLDPPFEVTKRDEELIKDCVICGTSRSIKRFTSPDKHIASESTAPARRAVDGKATKLITDNGGEFISGTLGKFLADWGVIHILTAPDEHQQNGKIERAHRTLREISTRALMQSTLWANIYWDSAWLYAVQSEDHILLEDSAVDDADLRSVNSNVAGRPGSEDTNEDFSHENSFSEHMVKLQKAFAPGTQSPSVVAHQTSPVTLPKQLHILDEDDSVDLALSGTAELTREASAVETASQSGDDNQDAVDSETNDEDMDGSVEHILGFDELEDSSDSEFSSSDVVMGFLYCWRKLLREMSGCRKV